MSGGKEWREVLVGYQWLGVVLAILAAGIAAVLLIQPPPLTYTVGWSPFRPLDEIVLGRGYQALVDDSDVVHLLWPRRVERVEQVFYAQIDDQGKFILGPTQLSKPGIKSIDPSMVLTSEGKVACFWLELEEARRVVMRIVGQEPVTLKETPNVIRDAVSVGDGEGHIFVAWSEMVESNFDIHLLGLDERGEVVFPERLLSQEPGFAFQPAIAVAGGVIHLVHFDDEVTYEEALYRPFDLEGRPLAQPRVLTRVTQTHDLGTQGYPVTLKLDPRGALYLLESFQGEVRYTKIGPRGEDLVTPRIVLMGGTRGSHIDMEVRGGTLQLTWPEERSGGRRFQIYSVTLDQEGNITGQESRLTHSPSSAVWPVMVTDHKGQRHLFWQEALDPYTFALMYSNDIYPLTPSLWQRLGFPSGSSFLHTIGLTAMMSILSTMLNSWRFIVAWLLSMLFLVAVDRLEIKKAKSPAFILLVTLVTLALIVRPVSAVIGFPPLDLVPAAPWLFLVTATLLTLYIAYLWQQELTDIFRWAGMSILWGYSYYLLNVLLILREGLSL
ncbi:MAG: hypothetical protein WBH57_04600 [Anaerolineae bacterium]